MTSVYIKVIITILVWGASFVFTKQALGEVSPSMLVLMRCALAAMALGVFSGGWSWLKELTGRDWAKMIFLSVLGVGFHQWLQGQALLRTSANHAGWLIAANPMVTVALMSGFLGERIGRLRLAGFSLGFLGVLFVVFSNQTGAGGAIIPTGAGDLLFLCSCFTWSSYAILTNRWLPHIPIGRVTILNMVISMFIMAAVTGFGGLWHELAGVSSRGWISLAYLGFLSSALAYSYWNEGLDKLGPSSVSSFLYLEPVTALITAYLVLGETISVCSIIGGLMIIAGVYWINGGRRGVGLLKKAYGLVLGA